jgi:fluoroquinolone transport system permease protein
MKDLIKFIRQDLLLLRRYRILQISLLVTLIYIAVFRFFSQYSFGEKVLILVIFNDPALLGFLFSGVLLLFEKNERTLAALLILPAGVRSYLIARTVSFSLLGLFCCLLMGFASGSGFNVLLFSAAALLSTALFTLLGFSLVAGAADFNSFLLRAVGVLVFLSLPFAGYYNLLPSKWFFLFPSQPCIALFDASFNPASTRAVVSSLFFSMAWITILFKIAVNRLESMLCRM